MLPIHAGLLLLGTLNAQARFDVLHPCPDRSLTADGTWKINAPDRPKPPRVEPKTESELATSAVAPADAIRLFDGQDLSQWQSSAWKVGNGQVEIVHKGNLTSKENFGSCRLHLEWSTPPPPPKAGQKAGNSGVYLMSQYEIQILDTFSNETYADGMAGAVYGQNPPAANALRPSGQWQYYDIEFRRPQFDSSGALVAPAFVTVYLNGIRVQDHFPIEGVTGPPPRKGYRAHPDRMPLVLQGHDSLVPVRFRNIWLVPLPD